MNAFRLIDRYICILEDWMMVVLTIAGLSMAILQVVLRYVFNTGIHWLEAAMVTCLIWGMLFGAVRAVREGFHPRVELLAQILGYRLRVILNIAALTLTLGLVVFYLFDSVFYTRFLVMINSLHPEINIRQVWLYLIIPITMALFVIRYIMIAVTLVLRHPGSVHLEKPLLEVLANNREEKR